MLHPSFIQITQDVFDQVAKEEIPPLLELLRLAEAEDPLFLQFVRRLSELVTEKRFLKSAKKEPLVRTAALLGGTMAWYLFKVQDHRNRKMN